MTPQEFINLSKADAQAHLLSLAQNNAWTERDRMIENWWKAKRETIDSPCSQQQSGAAGPLPSPTLSKNSLMLAGGRAVFGFGAVGCTVSAFMAAGKLGQGDLGALPWLMWCYLFGGLCSLGVSLWVAGAIEQRLIQIIGRLPANPT